MPLVYPKSAICVWTLPLALEKDLDSMYEVFNISGGHPQNPWSNKKAEKLLGYEPKSF
jgi:hypothetical protein